MYEQRNDATGPTAGEATTPAARKPYHPPTLRTYGTVRDLTMTNAAGPNFDGGGGANIYAS
jgi:hypothetical protein